MFEVTVSSTGLVLLTHLLIPLFVLKDVARIKEKVLKDLITFREKYLKSGFVPRDEEEGSVAVEGEEKTLKQEGNQPPPPPFNAAKYLFVSWRVASLCRELPESRLVLHFSTPWPKKKFGEKEAEVASEYEQDVLFNAISQIALFFIVSLLNCHVLLQDMIIQTVCSSGFGFLVLWLIQLYTIHPVLPGVVVLILVLSLSYFVRISSIRNSEIGRRLTSITSTPCPSDRLSPHPPLSSPHSLHQLSSLQTVSVYVTPHSLSPTSPYERAPSQSDEESLIQHPPVESSSSEESSHLNFSISDDSDVSISEVSISSGSSSSASASEEESVVRGKMDRE
jgi:hypothetical protein